MPNKDFKQRANPSTNTINTRGNVKSQTAISLSKQPTNPFTGNDPVEGGGIYVKTVTPTELYFVDDAGEETRLDTAGGGGPVSNPVTVAQGGTGLTTAPKGTVLVANTANVYSSLDGGGAADGFLFYTQSSDTISWATTLGIANGGTAQTTYAELGSLPLTADSLFSSITTNPTNCVAATYTGLTATGGAVPGSGAVFTCICTTTITHIQATTAGSNYVVGDVLTIAAESLGAGSSAAVLTLGAFDVCQPFISATSSASVPGQFSSTNGHLNVSGEVTADGAISSANTPFDSFICSDTILGKSLIHKTLGLDPYETHSLDLNHNATEDHQTWLDGGTKNLYITGGNSQMQVINEGLEVEATTVGGGVVVKSTDIGGTDRSWVVSGTLAGGARGSGFKRVSDTLANSWEDGYMGNAARLTWTGAEMMSDDTANPVILWMDGVSGLAVATTTTTAHIGFTKMIPKGFQLKTGANFQMINNLVTGSQTAGNVGIYCYNTTATAGAPVSTVKNYSAYTPGAVATLSGTAVGDGNLAVHFHFEPGAAWAKDTDGVVAVYIDMERV